MAGRRAADEATDLGRLREVPVRSQVPLRFGGAGWASKFPIRPRSVRHAHEPQAPGGRRLLPRPRGRRGSRRDPRDPQPHPRPGLGRATTTDSTEPTADAGVRGFGHHGGVQLEAAAEAIGITEDELRTALEDGQSIAQVAEANGVDVQTVIDAMVAAATERLEAAIDELPERMAEVVEREGLPDRGPGGTGRGHFGAGLDAAAEAIGIESEELRTALRDGSTIAEVAEANDVEVQTVIDALVADAEAHARRGGGRRPPHRGAGRRDQGQPPRAHRGHGERRGSLRWPDGPPPAADADAEGSDTPPEPRCTSPSVGALRGAHCRV